MIINQTVWMKPQEVSIQPHTERSVTRSDQVAQDFLQPHLENLQGQRSHYFPGQVWNFAFFSVLIKFYEVPVLPSSQAVKVLHHGSLALTCIISSPSLVWTADLLSTHFVTYSSSLIKILNRMGPRTDPCNMPHISRLWVEYEPLTTALWS